MKGLSFFLCDHSRPVMSFQNGLHEIAKFVIRSSGSFIHPLYKIQTYSSSSLVLDLLIRELRGAGFHIQKMCLAPRF